VAIPDFDEPIDVEAVKASLIHLHAKVDSIMAEIGPGIPPATDRGKRESIRDRLHNVENDSRTIKLLAEGLMASLKDLGGIVTDLKREKDEAQIAQKALETARLAHDQAWSRRAKIFLFSFAAVGAIGTAVTIFIAIVDRAAS